MIKFDLNFFRNVLHWKKFSKKFIPYWNLLFTGKFIGCFVFLYLVIYFWICFLSIFGVFFFFFFFFHNPITLESSDLISSFFDIDSKMHFIDLFWYCRWFGMLLLQRAACQCNTEILADYAKYWLEKSLSFLKVNKGKF